MANYIKGNVQFTPVVEQINRKWAPKAKKCSSTEKLGPVETEANSWMGSGTRKSYRGKIGSVSRNYFVFRENARSSVAKATELTNRSLFEVAAKAANFLMKDLMQIARLQAMYIGGTISGKTYEGAANNPALTVNGVSASGYTLKGWVMAVQHAGKKESASYDVNTFPTEYDA